MAGLKHPPTCTDAPLPRESRPGGWGDFLRGSRGFFLAGARKRALGRPAGPLVVAR